MSPYQELRKAVADEVRKPGHVTKAELDAVLARFPEQHPDDQPAQPSDGLLRLG